MTENLLLSFSAIIALLLPTDCRAQSATNAAHPPCCENPATVDRPITDRSLYQLDSTWLDDLGHPMKLARLRGRPQIVCMFFASCQYACPLLVNKMKAIEGALPENIRTNAGFLLASFDSERDTPSALLKYRLQHDLPPGRWTLLHGTSDDVLELAALLGVKFKKDPQGQFMHSNMLTVLDSEGEIVFQDTGLDLSPLGVVNALQWQTNWTKPTMSPPPPRPANNLLLSR